MKLIIGVGVPGCGKTTYLKPLAANLHLDYINPDEIREQLTGSMEDHSQEPEVWALVHQKVTEGIKDKGAVLDATYTRRRDRRIVIDLARQYGAQEIIAYWFNLPLDSCMERNRLRSRRVPNAAIEKMYNRLQINPPTEAEGFTQIIELHE